MTLFGSSKWVTGKRLLLVAILGVLLVPRTLGAQTEKPAKERPDSLPTMEEVGKLASRVEEEETDSLAKPIRILLMVTVLSILPGLLLMSTSFTRIVIVLAFIRRALTTRRIPPTPVVIGLALFLSVFVMSPTLSKMNDVALQPYISGEMKAQTALKEGVKPLRTFMLKQTGKDELSLFIQMSGVEEKPAEPSDVQTHVLIPAFVTSELKKAFELGFVLYLPFLILDLVVASVLLSMGMMMLPPVIISAPLKILLFVLVDGWSLVAQSLVLSFGGG